MKELLASIEKLLTEEQIRQIAKEYKVSYAAIMAIIKTETAGKGFYDGTLIPIVRFENHIFHKETNGKYTKTNPELSSMAYTNKYNKAGIAEFYRFLEAYKLDKNAAIKSTSWGLGQVLGRNYETVGDTPEEFMKLMFDSERQQLLSVMNFINKNNILKAMQEERWNDLALIYNGRNYKANKYDEKLATYYKQYNKM